MFTCLHHYMRALGAVLEAPGLFPEPTQRLCIYALYRVVGTPMYNQGN